MDHYELRFWRGWHHHMTLVILAHHFLVRLRQRLMDHPERAPTLSSACSPAHRVEPPAGERGACTAGSS